jgi:hypothetical protein
MVVQLAAQAGIDADHLYFNIEKIGNVSSASIPIALFDAVREGVIDRPLRVFAPGFGAGAVGGYAVLTIDPSIVAPEVLLQPAESPAADAAALATAVTTSDDVRVAFGE